MKTKWLCSILILLFIGCANINVYVTFPEKKIEEAADDILAPMDSVQGRTQSFFRFGLGREAYAQEIGVTVKIKTNSPEITQARKKRDSWANQLKDFKEKGFIGESNDFRVVLKNTPEEKTLAENVREMIQEENRQRNIIIQGIIKINNVPEDQEEIFRRIFADSVIKKYTSKGSWIQLNNGKWVKK